MGINYWWLNARDSAVTVSKRVMNTLYSAAAYLLEKPLQNPTLRNVITTVDTWSGFAKVRRMRGMSAILQRVFINHLVLIMAVAILYEQFIKKFIHALPTENDDFEHSADFMFKMLRNGWLAYLQIELAANINSLSKVAALEDPNNPLHRDCGDGEMVSLLSNVTSFLYFVFDYLILKTAQVFFSFKLIDRLFPWGNLATEFGFVLLYGHKLLESGVTQKDVCMTHREARLSQNYVEILLAGSTYLATNRALKKAIAYVTGYEDVPTEAFVYACCFALAITRDTPYRATYKLPDIFWPGRVATRWLLQKGGNFLLWLVRKPNNLSTASPQVSPEQQHKWITLAGHIKNNPFVRLLIEKIFSRPAMHQIYGFYADRIDRAYNFILLKRSAPLAGMVPLGSYIPMNLVLGATALASERQMSEKQRGQLAFLASPILGELLKFWDEIQKDLRAIQKRVAVTQVPNVILYQGNIPGKPLPIFDDYVPPPLPPAQKIVPVIAAKPQPSAQLQPAVIKDFRGPSAPVAGVINKVESEVHKEPRISLGVVMKVQPKMTDVAARVVEIEDASNPNNNIYLIRDYTASDRNSEKLAEEIARRKKAALGRCVESYWLAKREANKLAAVAKQGLLKNSLHAASPAPAKVPTVKLPQKVSRRPK